MKQEINSIRPLAGTRSWDFVYQQGNDEHPSAMFTIGLSLHFHHPELMVRNLQREDAMRVLELLAMKIQHGFALQPDLIYEGLVKGSSICVQEIEHIEHDAQMQMARSVLDNSRFLEVFIRTDEKVGRWRNSLDVSFIGWCPLPEGV